MQQYIAGLCQSSLQIETVKICIKVTVKFKRHTVHKTHSVVVPNTSVSETKHLQMNKILCTIKVSFKVLFRKVTEY